MDIGGISYKNPFFLAPLAGYSDRAFREMCLSYGASATVTEMVSAEGLSRNSGKTEELLLRANGEKLLTIQLFGPDKDPFERCVGRLMAYDPTMVDVNCGCPVPKVVRTGSGSALMNTPDKITGIVKALKDLTHRPVSVKFRLGWDDGHVNYLEFAKAAADGGVDMMTLHCRTRSQGYEGKADWSHLKKLKDEYESTGIRIFGSGDVFSAEDAVRMLGETGCDGVMFARGAIGNPFIFREAIELLENGRAAKPSIEERIEALRKHLSLECEYLGEEKAAKEMRKHAAAYIKGMKGAGRIRERLVTSKRMEDYMEALGQITQG